MPHSPKFKRVPKNPSLEIFTPLKDENIKLKAHVKLLREALGEMYDKHKEDAQVTRSEQRKALDNAYRVLGQTN